MAESTEFDCRPRARRGLARCEFDENPNTLGYAPMWVPEGTEFVAWDARYRFWQAVHLYANQTNERLLELWEENGGKVLETDLNGWARQFHLLHRGQPAEWVLRAARLAEFQWQVTDAENRLKAEKGLKAESEGRPKTPILFPPLAATGALAVTDDECRINLPPLSWSPLQVSRLPDGNRPLTKVQFRRAVVGLLDKEINRIEALARKRGAVRVPANRNKEHFEWTVRFQVNGERVSTMARGVAEQERKIRKAIGSVLSWLPLDRRRDPSGRPRN